MSIPFNFTLTYNLYQVNCFSFKMSVMVDYHKCFIQNMKFYRKKKGISQAQLAESCNVSNGTIGNIECGRTKPSFDLILIIANSLEIKPESLFYSSESPSFSKTVSDKFSKTQLSKVKIAFNSAISKALEELKK